MVGEAELRTARSPTLPADGLLMLSPLPAEVSGKLELRDLEVLTDEHAL